jgi:hypothetical protein
MALLTMVTAQLPMLMTTVAQLQLMPTATLFMLIQRDDSEG